MIISRNRSLLYPPFADQLRYFESRLTAAKLPFYLFMGLRTFECQDELYAQGRTKPGKIVTNARGGESLHNYFISRKSIRNCSRCRDFGVRQTILKKLSQDL